MNILLILHSYAADGNFGSFAKELIDGFRNTGADIDLIKTNDLFTPLGDSYFTRNLDTKKLKSILGSKRYDMIFTTNHGGMSRFVRKHTRNAQVVTWLVDRNPFNHNGRLTRNPFSRNDHVITSSTANVSALREKFSLADSKVHYLPFMTNPASFALNKEKDINISFVGSYFLNEQVVADALEASAGTKYEAPLQDAIKELIDDFDVNEDELVRRYGLGFFLLAQRISRRQFKGAVGNTISNRKRLEFLSAIAEMGLKLYGTRNFAELVNIKPNIAACYSSNYFVNNRERLVDIYDRSKIGLNINHHQATTGLGYRVFDIMASSALLVSNYQKVSDLDELFGKDHPVPIYKTADELKEICTHYLEDEEARISVTEKCRQLIGDVHTFDQRAVDIIRIVEPNFKPAPERGAFRRYTSDDLWTFEALRSHTEKSDRKPFYSVLKKGTASAAARTIKNIVGRR